MEMTPFGCSGKVRRSSPVVTFHKRIVLSLLPLASRELFGENATEATGLVCPVRVVVTLPVRVSHNRITFSPVATARVFPSGLSEILESVPPLCVTCSEMVFRSCPVCASHNRIVLSQLRSQGLHRPSNKREQEHPLHAQ